MSVAEREHDWRDYLRRQAEDAEDVARDEHRGAANGSSRDETVGILGEWDAGDDDEPIPPRGWLLGNVFCRRVVSEIIAGGGVGKTALRMAQLLSLASERALTGEHVFQRCRVLLISLEDDRDELRRRLKAAMLHYGITQDDIRGWLFLAAPGRKAGKLASLENNTLTEGRLAAEISEVITRRQIDLVCIDPLVKAHSVPENSNDALDFVLTILAEVAIKHDCAVDTPHHVRKGTPEPGNADNGRGGGANKDAARLVYTLAPMAPEEAKTFGVHEKDRRRFVRMDSGKVNIAPPTEAKWFELIGVRLGNRSEMYPNGDEVQTVKPWDPPDTWAGLSHETLNAALTDLDAGMESGERFSSAGAAGKRAAWPVVQRHCPDRTEKQCREIIKTWVKNGVLTEQLYDDPEQRKELKGLRLDPKKRPS